MAVGALLAAPGLAERPGTLPPDPLPALWDVDRSIANLENVHRGATPREVEAEYLAEMRFLNQRNILFACDGLAGQELSAAMERVRAEVATLLGAPPDEFVLTRNGTEALQNLTMQYGRLAPGDAVMYADFDYDEMQ